MLVENALETNRGIRKQYEEYLSDGENNYSRRWDDSYASSMGKEDDGKPPFQQDKRLSNGIYDPRHLQMVSGLSVTDFLQGKIKSPEYKQSPKTSREILNVQL